MTYPWWRAGAGAALLIASLIACDDSTSAPRTRRRIEPASSLSIRGVVGSPVPGPAVKIVDGRGEPLSDVTVHFFVAGGGGSVTVPRVVTGSDGAASAGTWTLGPKSMMNIVRVIIDSAPTVDFLAFADPGPPAALKVVVGSSQAGFVGSRLRPPRVLVVDANENNVFGALVQFTGTRGSDPSYVVTATSGNSGEAAPDSWQLGPTAGTYTITATTAGAAPIEITAIALDQSSIVAIYDVSTIDGRLPSTRGLAQSTIYLSSTGHFIEVTRPTAGDSAQSSGTYSRVDPQITFVYANGYLENGTITPSVLTINRLAYYYGFEIWVYTRRSA